jgi:hypothetical protein
MMKQVVFLVDEARSYVKWPLAKDVKPGGTVPLIVPLQEGGTVSLTIDEKKSRAFGLGESLWFTTDQIPASTTLNSTGNLQAFKVRLAGLSLQFDPKTGKMLFATASLFAIGEPHAGGEGSWCLTSLSAPSSLRDSGRRFTISNGLGCGGGIILELGTSGSDGVDFFIVHLEGTVGVEDADGDGVFEVTCKIKPLKPWIKRRPPFPPDIPTAWPRPIHRVRAR